LVQQAKALEYGRTLAASSFKRTDTNGQSRFSLDDSEVGLRQSLGEARHDAATAQRDKERERAEFEAAALQHKLDGTAGMSSNWSKY
jgi:hypothetical protein